MRPSDHLSTIFCCYISVLCVNVVLVMYTYRKLLCRHRILLFWALKSREIVFLLYSNTCLTTHFRLGTISEFLGNLLGFFDGECDIFGLFVRSAGDM